MITTKNYNVYLVMYHYVREIKKSKYPNIKGLEFEDFKKQINYFLNNFNILSNDDFTEIIKTKKIPKKKSILLTFDDGYKCHWEYAYPYLKKKKISGNFYPLVDTIENKRVLNVNKIHFILEKELEKIFVFITNSTGFPSIIYSEDLDYFLSIQFYYSIFMLTYECTNIYCSIVEQSSMVIGLKIFSYGKRFER